MLFRTSGIHSSSMTEREGEILRLAIEAIVRHLAADRIYLFGSRAKNNAKDHSDFDFAVEAARPDRRLERLLMEELDRISGLYHIDVVFLDSVDDSFRKMVLKTGKVVHERGS